MSCSPESNKTEKTNKERKKKSHPIRRNLDSRNYRTPTRRIYFKNVLSAFIPGEIKSVVALFCHEKRKFSSLLSPSVSAVALNSNSIFPYLPSSQEMLSCRDAAVATAQKRNMGVGGVEMGMTCFQLYLHNLGGDV